MGNLAPVALALIVVLALAVVGGLAAIVRHMARYRAYQALATDAQDIAKALGGQVFRDGADLVMSGNQERWPVVVRWSHSESTPGLDIRMEAPAGFTLWVAAKTALVGEGRAQLRTANPLFDARFGIRSDHPTQAAMMLAGKNVLASIQKLCCSGNTVLAVTRGALELTEHVIPQPFTTSHVLDHVAAMARIADFLKTMPGAEQFKILPIRRERHVLGRLTVAAGVLAAVLTVVAASKQPEELPLDSATPAVPEGVLPLDATQIANVSRYRLATAADFDPAAVAWLRASRVEASGRVPGNFLGAGQAPDDVAYLLLDKAGTRRLVLLAGKTDRYDLKFDYVGLIACVPKGIVGSIDWIGRPPQQPDGDGLLIVRRADDVKSGLVLFFSNGRIISAVPANYQRLSLR